MSLILAEEVGAVCHSYSEGLSAHQVGKPEMVKKKNLKANNSQGNQAVSPRSRKKILGMDVKDLGAAIAAAVIGEIAQVAIRKANQKTDSDGHNNPVDSAQKSVQGAVDSVRTAFSDNPLQHGASVIAGAVNQVNPSLAKVADAMKETPKAVEQSVGDTVSTTQQTAEDTIGDVTKSMGNTVDTANDTVKNAIQEATEKVISLFEDNNLGDKKGRKSKGKAGQKQGKKGKKKSKK